MGEAKRRRWRCACGAGNKATDDACEICGEVRPLVALARQEGKPDAPPVSARCRYDGETLRADGFCARGNGYPFGLVCPFSCPICRGPLGWDGGCTRCYGSPTSMDRSTWTFPGDRYEFDDEDGTPRGDGRHWILVAKGPRPVYRPTKAEVEGIQSMLERSVAKALLASARAEEATP